MTDKQKAFVTYLESLVGTRTAIPKLKAQLEDYLQEYITLEDISDKDNSIIDYNLLFESKNKYTCGFFDIYYLKMRKIDFDGSDIYITEINYKFE